MATEGSGTVTKALKLLNVLGDYPDGVAAGPLVDVVGYPFSTVYRLLNTLVGAGFVTYDPREKRYRLGLRIFQLGQKVASSRGFEGTALPILQDLTAHTGESSLLSVLDGDRQLTVHKVDGPQFRTTTDPGDHGPLHTSAVGKALLAYADKKPRDTLLETIDLTPRTEHSITNRSMLKEQIEQIRHQGWAGQQEENDPGMAAIAVPVLSNSNRLIAAVALAAPIFRQDPQGLRNHLPRLHQAATELSAQLPLR